MQLTNRKKLAVIKKKVIGSMYVNMGKQSQGRKVDEEYAEALRLLGKAIQEIEYSFGDLD